MRVVLLCLLAAFLAVPSLLAVPADAQQARTIGGGGRIAAVQVVGNQRIEPETVQSYLLLGVGDSYDPERVDKSLKALFTTGLFADVSIRRQGDTLVVNVVENPIINRLAFEGNRRIEDSVLEQEVRLRPRVVYTRSRVQSDVERILQVYRRNGRFSVTVEPKVIQLEQNRVDLVFEIDEGPVTEIRRIDFIGNNVFSDSELLSAIATQESAWWRVFSNADSYDPDRVTLDRELLRKFYLQRGYADFRVVSAVADLSQDRSEFFITFTVEEGEQYKFGEIDLATSLRNLDPERLRTQLTTVPDETYDAEAVDLSIERLTFAVGQLGYAFVDIRPRINRRREERLIDLTYEINEGPRVYVERVNINGNVRTLDKVIRREFQLVEGDAFNTAKLRRSRQRVRRLGFFEKVEVTQERGTQPDRVVLNVDVEERSTGELSFGVGVSTSETVVGDVGIRERNLLGRGQDLRLGVSASPRQQQIDLSFTEPYFLDRNLAAGFDVFRIQRDNQDRSSYDEDNLGFRLRSNFGITENLRQGLSYTIREDTISNVDSSTSPLIRLDEGSFITSSIGYDLTYDTRDDIILPSTGVLIKGGQEFAGLGGDIRFVRTNATWSYYYPFTEEVVGNLSVRGGHIDGIGQNVRVLDRFFLGGDSFRGFESGGVGPRDSSTDDSIGGNVFYVATSELRFPLGLPNDLGIVGRVFAEAGTLTGVDVGSASLESSKTPRLTLGFGLSWQSPFGPIRVDAGQAVVKEDFDKEELFRFSFGTRF